MVVQVNEALELVLAVRMESGHPEGSMSAIYILSREGGALVWPPWSSP